MFTICNLHERTYNLSKNSNDFLVINIRQIIHDTKNNHISGKLKELIMYEYFVGTP